LCWEPEDFELGEREELDLDGGGLEGLELLGGAER
jgi:hypothetical protein